MDETFSLEGGTPPERPGRRVANRVVLGVVLVLLALLVWRGLANRPVARSQRKFGAAFDDAAARQEAFRALLPEGRVPEPYVIRGAAVRDGLELVWLRYDYRDDHAFLLGGDHLPGGGEVKTLLAEVGGERLPGRQRIDAPGVLPERRPPFVEEYRERDPGTTPVHPPRGWATAWDEAVAFERRLPGAAEDWDVDLSLEVTPDLVLPFIPFRQDGAWWWTVVDLDARAPAGRHLYLVHAVRSEETPTMAATADFVAALLRVR